MRVMDKTTYKIIYYLGIAISNHNLTEAMVACTGLGLIPVSNRSRRGL